MPTRKHVQHIKSSQANKIPRVDDLLYGEIAVNYSDGNEKLFIKNTNNEIVSFVSSKVIEDNEHTTAAALSQLNENLEQIQTELQALESITYANLVTKVNNDELVPGKFYRINDYTTTTVQTNTQSANHNFDIIVLALSTNKLSENAYAVLHSGDTYFSDCDLSEWELKYCLENDDERFAWADSTNGKGVVYYMKDEWGNECPYDFKNIQFRRTLSNDKGYYISDEDGTGTWVYTFSANEHDLQSDEWSELLDGSLVAIGYNGVETIGAYYHNSIKPRFSANCKQFLNDNVFIGYYEVNPDVQNNQEVSTFCSYGNTLEINCYYNTFGFGCYYNKFDKGCYGNEIGNESSNNTFGTDCYSNLLGDECEYNSLDDNCYNNTFEHKNVHNKFGKRCYNNFLSDGSVVNVFGNICHDITLGMLNAYNVFENYCTNIVLGTYSLNNTIGNGCNNIDLNKGYFYGCIIETGNRYITLTSTKTPTINSPLRNITISQGVNNTNVMKTISHNTIGDTFRTVYQPINSVTVSV